MNYSVLMGLVALPVVTSVSLTEGCEGSGTDPSPTPSAADCTSSFLIEQVNAYDQVGSIPDPSLAVSCDDSYVYVTSNGIPAFTYTQVTPNALQAQDHNWKIPRNPAVASAATNIWVTGPVAIGVDGLPIYAPNEAPNDGYGDPVLDGLLDACNGHTDQAGAYHYHARPECLFEEIDGKVHLVLGWAFDGFPIVSPFECSNSSCSSTYEIKSSYVYVGGSDNAYEANQYQAGSGDLDACNGKTGSDGQYRYYATDTFPYIMACFKGTPEASNNPMGSGGGGGTQDPPDDGGQGPQACDVAADCANACPPGSVGCTCATDPMSGDGMCVPTCSRDADCPTGGPQALVCDEQAGICIPGN